MKVRICQRSTNHCAWDARQCQQKSMTLKTNWNHLTKASKKRTGKFEIFLQHKTRFQRRFKIYKCVNHSIHQERRSVRAKSLLVAEVKLQLLAWPYSVWNHYFDKALPTNWWTIAPIVCLSKTSKQSRKSLCNPIWGDALIDLIENTSLALSKKFKKKF